MASTTLTLSSQKSVILREQENKEAAISDIAKMLHRLAKLYQIPNWDGENAVLLAKWIIANYEYEPLDVVLDCLITPPLTSDKNWRLTPDTIQSWFTIRLNENAIKREKEYFKEKERLKLLENNVPERNWPDFDKLLAGTWFEDASKGKNFEQGYEKFKEERLKGKLTEAELTPKPSFFCVMDNGGCKTQCTRCLEESKIINQTKI